jgi:MYND finger
MQKDRLFPVCSICKSTNYCSKRCQQEDWKKHKVYCQPAVEHQDPQLKQIERRVDRFRAKTVPLLEMIVCLKFYHYQLENCNETHVLDRFEVRIVLGGLPFEIQAIYMIPKPITPRQSKYFWELFVKNNDIIGCVAVYVSSCPVIKIPMDRKERKALANKVELQIKDATNYINDMSTKRRPDLLAAVKRGHEAGKVSQQ